MDNAFEQIFGYNPLEKWKDTRWINRDKVAPLVDAQIGYMGQQETNKANAQLAQQQNDFNLMMWNKQNEYNSPEATMKRLVEAGINPRAYQQIGQFANASQPHKAEKPDYDSPLGKLAKFTEAAKIKLAYKQLTLDSLNKSADILQASARLAEERSQYRTTLAQRKYEFRSMENLRNTQADLNIMNEKKVSTDIVGMMQSQTFQREKHELENALRGVTRNADGSINIPSGVYGLMNNRDLQQLAFLSAQAKHLEWQEKHGDKTYKLSQDQFEQHKKEYMQTFIKDCVDLGLDKVMQTINLFVPTGQLKMLGETTETFTTKGHSVTTRSYDYGVLK